MSSGSHVKNIAVVGASGQVGSAALHNLLECGTFNLTAISRHDSSASFPPGVTVKKGDYSSSEFLESALHNQDVLVITLGGRTPPNVQTKLIDAAANAGVPWILPNEYGGDGDNEEFASMVSIIGDKKKYRDQIEELGKSSWIGICCNLWFDYGLRVGIWNIDILNRKATLFDNADTPIVTTTIAQTGRAIARLLSLPVHSSSSPCLSDYKNSYCYVRSFSVTQRDMLAAVQRATHTKPEDWDVATRQVDDYIKEGKELTAQGNMMGWRNLLAGATMKEGLMNQYHGRELANEKLGLKDEHLDRVVESR